MKKLFISTLLISSCIVAIYAENNESIDANQSSENNNSTKIELKNEENNMTKVDKIEKQLQEQMKREEKYAKEKTFYQGNDYDLSASEVNEDSLANIELLEPDYEFNMDDVYD